MADRTTTPRLVWTKDTIIGLLRQTLLGLRQRGCAHGCVGPCPSTKLLDELEVDAVLDAADRVR